MSLKIVVLDYEYCDYLRKFDCHVPYNNCDKKLRPYVGILFVVNNCEYFAPLSSPKAKHINMKDYVDFIKIQNGELGVVNFNNMIPVKKSNYSLIDLDKDERLLENRKYQIMIKKQSWWLKDNFLLVQKKAIRLYQLYENKHLNKRVMDRCCNFKLLEEKCSSYEKYKINI